MWLGLSPVVWLILAGCAVARRASCAGSGTAWTTGAGRSSIPPCSANAQLQGGLTAFFFQYLLQAGLFFVVPLFLSVALGLSAIATGVRLLPLSITLLLAAVGIPKLFPHASPRRVVQLGFSALFLGIVVMIALLDVGAGPEIVTWPMLLAGLGVGALASQLGAVTVSAVPDEQSGEVGGLQNTVTNLGASIGTALTGAVLISVLTTLVPHRARDRPRGQPTSCHRAPTSSCPAASHSSPTRTSRTGWLQPGVDGVTSDAVVEENATARIEGLRAALAVLALLTFVALWTTRRIPTSPPGAQGAPAPPDGAQCSST